VLEINLSVSESEEAVDSDELQLYVSCQAHHFTEQLQQHAAVVHHQRDVDPINQ